MNTGYLWLIILSTSPPNCWPFCAFT
jgi:hypothetical protein